MGTNQSRPQSEPESEAMTEAAAILSITHGRFAPFPADMDISNASEDSTNYDMILSSSCEPHLQWQSYPLYHISVKPPKQKQQRADIIVHRAPTPTGMPLATAAFHTLHPIVLRAARDPFGPFWTAVEGKVGEIGTPCLALDLDLDLTDANGTRSALRSSRRSLPRQGRAAHCFAAWIPGATGAAEAVEEFAWEEVEEGDSSKSQAAGSNQNSADNGETVEQQMKCVRRSDGSVVAVATWKGCLRVRFLDVAALLGPECRLLVIVSLLAIVEGARRRSDGSVFSPSSAKAKDKMMREKVGKESSRTKIYMPSSVVDASLDSPLNRSINLTPSVQLGMSASLRPLVSPGLVL